MKKRRFSEDQMMTILREAEGRSGCLGRHSFGGRVLSTANALRPRYVSARIFG